MDIRNFMEKQQRDVPELLEDLFKLCSEYDIEQTEISRVIIEILTSYNVKDTIIGQLNYVLGEL